MIAAKSGAIFLGPEGVGVSKLYASVINLIRTATSLGISSSGVREVALAIGSGEAEKVGRTVRILRKACWATGVFGWLISALLCWPLSIWVFNHAGYALPIALLGCTIMLAAISGGQTALLQGTRNIAALAKINVLGSLSGVVISIPLFWLLGKNGIVPSMVLSAAVSLVISWNFSRKIEVPNSEKVSWNNAARESKQLIGLGVAQMWGNIMTTLASTITAAVIVRWFGMEANGIYGAAWALSGFFANFILSSMASDFYPRLTTVQSNHPLVNQLVNEQTEIGVLLALPGIIASLFFAPLVIKLFYTSEFLAAADLLPWFLFGVMGRVISWPMGFVMLAKGASKQFAATETFFNLFGLALSLALMHFGGLKGASISFFVLYLVHTIALILITHRLTGFVWSRGVRILVTVTILSCLFANAIIQFLPDAWIVICGILLSVSCGLFCARGVVHRLGTEHKLFHFFSRYSIIRLFLGISR